MNFDVIQRELAGNTMSRTKHHRAQKHCHNGDDWGARYKCDKGYCGGTGKTPKQLAKTERRVEGKNIILKELNRGEDHDSI